jgi:hypothetical protein
VLGSRHVWPMLLARGCRLAATTTSRKYGGLLPCWRPWVYIARQAAWWVDHGIGTSEASSMEPTKGIHRSRYEHRVGRRNATMFFEQVAAWQQLRSNFQMAIGKSQRPETWRGLGRSTVSFFFFFANSGSTVSMTTVDDDDGRQLLCRRTCDRVSRPKRSRSCSLTLQSFLEWSEAILQAFHSNAQMPQLDAKSIFRPGTQHFVFFSWKQPKVHNIKHLMIRGLNVIDSASLHFLYPSWF